MKGIFGNPKKVATIDTVIRNRDCNDLFVKMHEQYTKSMTGVIIIIEKDKQTWWECAGMDPAQAILSLDQLHHRVQHEGLKDYD